MEPGMTSTIALRVYNHNRVLDDLVSSVYFDFKELKAIQVLYRLWPQDCLLWCCSRACAVSALVLFVQVENMRALGLPVPDVKGNAGIRGPEFHKKRSVIKRIFG